VTAQSLSYADRLNGILEPRGERKLLFFGQEHGVDCVGRQRNGPFFVRDQSKPRLRQRYFVQPAHEHAGLGQGKRQVNRSASARMFSHEKLRSCASRPATSLNHLVRLHWCFAP